MNSDHFINFMALHYLNVCPSSVMYYFCKQANIYPVQTNVLSTEKPEPSVAKTTARLDDNSMICACSHIEQECIVWLDSMCVSYEVSTRYLGLKTLPL